MPRVLFIHHRPQASGAARSLALLIGALGPGWEPHVVVPGGAAAELFERAGAQVHRGPVPAFTHTWDVQYRGLRWLVALRELVWLPAHVRVLRRLLRDLQPAIVHLNDSVLVWSAIVAHHAGIPVVWHVRSSLANGGRDRRARWICSVIDRTGAAAIAIDSDVASTFSLRIPITIVLNPVVVRDGPPAELGVPEGKVAIGYIGFLRRQKGWPQFLEALRLLVDQGLPVYGVVVGGGIRPHSAFRGVRGPILSAVGVPDEEGDFAASLARLSLGDHLTWLPFTLDIDAVYRGLDIVCFPNQGAGLGRPVLEAAAYGIPVVASGSSTSEKLPLAAASLILERGDARSLAVAIGKVMTGPASAHRAPEDIRTSLSPDASADAVRRVFASALAKRSRG